MYCKIAGCFWVPQKVPKSRSNFNKILIIKYLQKSQMDVRWKKSESMGQNLAKLDIIGGKRPERA